MVCQCEECVHNKGNCELGLFPQEGLDCDEWEEEKNDQK